MDNIAFEFRNGAPDGDAVDGDTSHGKLGLAICEFMMAFPKEFKYIVDGLGQYLVFNDVDGEKVTPGDARTWSMMAGPVTSDFSDDNETLIEFMQYLGNRGCQGTFCRVGPDLTDLEEIDYGGYDGEFGPIIHRTIEFIN